MRIFSKNAEAQRLALDHQLLKNARSTFAPCHIGYMSTQPEDSAPACTDTVFFTQLNEAIARYQRFSSSFSRTLTAVFSFCDWQLVPQTHGVELVITCTSDNVRTQLFQNLLAIATRLQSLFGRSQIQIAGGACAFTTTTDQVIRYHRYWKRYGK